MTTTRCALFHSYLTNYVTLALNFVAQIIIARLLKPSETGVFSIAAAFVVLGYVIRDFGVSQDIIQEPDLAPDKIRAAFTVTLITGWSIALLIWLIAPLTDSCYEHAGIGEALALLTWNFIILPFGTISNAQLNRQMRLDLAMWINVPSALGQFIVSVSCAYLGMSYMSLAWEAIAGTYATFVMTNVLRPRGLPRLPRLRGIKEVKSFGSKIGFTRVLMHVADVTPELAILERGTSSQMRQIFRLPVSLH